MHFELHFIENIAKNYTEKLATLPSNFSIVTWVGKMEASGCLQTYRLATCPKIIIAHAYRRIFFSPAKAVVVDLWKNKLSLFGQRAFLSTGNSVLTEEHCNGIKCQGYSKLFSGLYFV